MDKIIEKLLMAADNHGEDSGEADHAVGDLQDLLRRAWNILSVSQKLQFLNSQEAADLIVDGARGDFKAGDLVAEINQQIAKMEEEVGAAGYAFIEHGAGFFWETDEESSEDFLDREDAVADAYKHYREASTS